MDKVVKIKLREGFDTEFDSSLSQWDFGQILQVEGLTLPDGDIEVHFSLTENNGDASVLIGVVEDNVITVDIPDFILAKENEYQPSYEAYAWIYLTDGESGQTIRKIVFTVETRAKPTTGVPEPKQDEFLEEVRNIMAETKEIAQSVRDDADNGEFDGEPGPQGSPGDGGADEETLLKFAIKRTTEKNTVHHLTDSAEYRVLDFGIEGTSKRIGGESVNLVSPDLYTITGEGITVNDDGSITISGSASGDISIQMNLSACEEGYIFDLGIPNIQGGSGSVEIPIEEYDLLIVEHRYTYNYALNTVGVGLGEHFEVPSDGQLSVIIVAGFMGIENADITIYPNLNKGSVLQPWKPYGVSDTEPQIINAGTYNEETGRYGLEVFFTDSANTKSQTLTLTSPVPITKWDYLTKRDGVWGWSVNSISPVLNGSEASLVYYANSLAFYFRTGYQLGADSSVKCSHYDYSISLSADKTLDRVFKVKGGAYADMVWIRDLRFDNVADYKTWLAENNITFTLKTASEVAFHPLPDEEQEMLRNTETYYGGTNITNDQNCPMWIQYVADTKLYIDQQLLAIKEAIV